MCYTKTMPYKDPQKRREASAKSALKYYRKNRDKCIEKQRKYLKRVKEEVLGHYSGGTFVCACCGEHRRPFLTIDHVNGGGTKDRRSNYGRNEGGHHFYRKIRREGFPVGFQVLCFNCNSGRHINKGVCPHEEERKKH